MLLALGIDPRLSFVEEHCFMFWSRNLRAFLPLSWAPPGSGPIHRRPVLSVVEDQQFLGIFFYQCFTWTWEARIRGLRDLFPRHEVYSNCGAQHSVFIWTPSYYYPVLLFVLSQTRAAKFTSLRLSLSCCCGTRSITLVVVWLLVHSACPVSSVCYAMLRSHGWIYIVKYIYTHRFILI